MCGYGGYGGPRRARGGGAKGHVKGGRVRCVSGDEGSDVVGVVVAAAVEGSVRCHGVVAGRVWGLVPT